MKRFISLDRFRPLDYRGPPLSQTTTPRRLACRLSLFAALRVAMPNPPLDRRALERGKAKDGPRNMHVQSE